MSSITSVAANRVRAGQRHGAAGGSVVRDDVGENAVRNFD
jgi:hypothetical protein